MQQKEGELHAPKRSVGSAPSHAIRQNARHSVAQGSHVDHGTRFAWLLDTENAIRELVFVVVTQLSRGLPLEHVPDYFEHVVLSARLLSVVPGTTERERERENRVDHTEKEIKRERERET